MPRDRVKKRVSWTTAEDNKLCALVQEKGAKDWGKLAEHFPGRNSRQVHQRWNYSLDPQSTFHNGGWTTEEDEKIITYHNEVLYF